MSKKNIIWILLALSAIFMSIPFLIPHCGFFALFGLVPLLCADKISDDEGLRFFWCKSYLCFLVWNFITTFWVCNATVGGGIFASVANALQMSVVFGLFMLSKRYFRGSLPYLFLMFTWIAWEKYYLTVAEISWPWLVLGNSFARSLRCIQWYEFTGTLGGSLWVWATNLSIFGMMVALSDGRFFTAWNRIARAASVTGLATVILVPFIISFVIWGNYKEEERPLDFFIVQPNFDPYEKFESMSQEAQDQVLLDLVDEGLGKDSSCSESCDSTTPLVILAPETFTGGIYTHDIPSSYSWQRYLGMLQEHRNANLLFGASTWEYIYSKREPSYTARKIHDGLWYESHNSALMMNCTGETSIFHKSKLVVGTELMPYPKFFSKIDKKLGGVMAHCIGQPEISLLNYHSEDGKVNIPLGCAVCYESIYGQYCTGYILKGAQALTVITNDAWWGNTPGYKQHCSFSSLRAIETRRSIARCANTGISCFINQRGEILEQTPWWERQTLRGTINLNDKYTYFVLHGDIIGRISVFSFILFLALLIVRLPLGHLRRR